MKFFSVIISCIVFSLNVNANDSMILDDLTTPGVTTQKQNWAFFTDGVMGGLSQGKAIIANVDGVDCYHMTGNVTTENNGGFIQIRSQLKPTISTKDYEGIYLEKGKCIIMEKKEVIKFANKNGIFISSVEDTFLAL